MATILVTGCAGFIGFHVSKALLERGDKVIGVDNLNDYYDVQLKKDRLVMIEKMPGFVFFKQDISEFDGLDAIFSKFKIDKVCHLAAQAGVRYSIDNPFAYERTNALGFLCILEQCKKHDIRYLVFASSSSVYGGNTKIPFSETDNVDIPISLYAATKKYNELQAHVYHHLFGIRCAGLRFFTVYGPWGRPDMALFKFTRNILADKPIDVYNNGNMQRDFTYIDDIRDGVLKVLDSDFSYEILNIGNNKSVNLKYFIELIEKETKKKAIMNLMPMQPGDVQKTFADIGKIGKLTGFTPKTSIEEGVKNSIRWYLDYYGDKK